MPYPPNHKARTRHKILHSAARLFAARGFAAVSIDEVMADCGLTRGAFYTHFASKAALYSEAMEAPPTSPDPSAAAQPGWLEEMLALARSPQAFDGAHVSRWAFLATDVARREPEVRAAYAQALRQLSERMPQAAADPAALSAVALVVGLLAIAVTVDDERLRHAVVDACRERLDRLGEEDATQDPARCFWWVEPRGQRPAH